MKETTLSRRPQHRNGAICVLAAIILPLIIALLALCIDLAYIGLVKAEAQRVADSAALAGCGAMFASHDGELTRYSLGAPHTGLGYVTALRFVTLHTENVRPGDYVVEPNTFNFAAGDIVLGRFAFGLFTATDFAQNAVQVRIPLLDSHANGSLTLFYPAKHLPFETVVTATAQIDYPTLLPFAVSEDLWNLGGSTNNYPLSDPDDIPELIVYPGAWNGVGTPPGNFGAIQLGSEASATTLIRQIEFGPTPTDLAWHNNALAAGDTVTGSTGLNATIQDPIEGNHGYMGVLGLPRYIMLYNFVEGVGTNAEFTITRFVAVEIMGVNLRGADKFIAVQPLSSASALHSLRLVL